MQELPLFEWAAGYQKGSDTSKEAAEKLTNSGKLARMRKQVLDVFNKSLFGLTADEVATIMGLPVTSVRPRVTELCNIFGLIDKTTERRKNVSGMSAAVYIKPNNQRDGKNG